MLRYLFFWTIAARLPSLVTAFVSPTTKQLRHEAETKMDAVVNDARTSLGIIAKSALLGDLYRIRIPGEEDDSFVSKMSVPTFAARPDASTEDDDDSTPPSLRMQQRRGLEGALDQGPAFVLDNVLSEEECHDLVKTTDELGFASYQAGKNHHGALQIIVSQELADKVGRRLSRHVDIEQVTNLYHEMNDEEDDIRLVYAGLNRRWRVYRYAPGGEERFAPHIDAGFPPSGLSEDGTQLIWDSSSDGQELVSRLTVLFYLNDDFVGGETKFFQPASRQQGDEPSVIASVRPKTGSCLVFPQGVGEDAVEHARKHWPLHEGSPVTAGNAKYVIRSDILFLTEREPISSDPFLRYDHLVRQAFLPKSPALDHNFRQHLASLYNPHMGVENMGPFLYSFLRITKKRRVVEIGAGYTSLWILQALKDNDEELHEIQQLQQEGKCRLLDWPWTEYPVVDSMLDEPAKLLCIDNCEHQKETASGASAVAKSLELGGYFSFLKADAFELKLEKNSVDVLWCDFGVGSRMKDFVQCAWSSVRPGGFLLCHSTLTNQRTRDWLEAARERRGEDITGLPPDEYVEVSLLEPHKHYQNSISIFQKRKGYEEPVYSEYA